jgi:glycogen synthase
MNMFTQMKRTKLNVRGTGEVSVLKDDIQKLLREIVIARDGGCILRRLRNCDDEVLQADHLITRANSATYVDSRLVVCLCRACHGGFKKWHKEQYDAMVKTLLPEHRVELWEKCEKERWIPQITTAHDWKLSKVLLEKELESYAQPDG